MRYIQQTIYFTETVVGANDSYFPLLFYNCLILESLQYRHNERDGASNHQPHHCLLKRLFKAQIKKKNIKAPRY